MIAYILKAIDFFTKKIIPPEKKPVEQEPSRLGLSEIEKEISVLLATRQSIKSMVNRGMLMFAEGDSGMTIKPNTSCNSKLFNILLVDFISPINPAFGKFPSYPEALQHICSNPHFQPKNSAAELHNAVEELISWLSHEAHFEKIWLPSIEKELDLSMRRDEFLRICGDISKHNQLRLSRTAQRILNILQRKEPTLNLSDAFSVIDEFYEWFHDNFFHYHLTKICELLNNVTWGIQAYLAEEFRQSYTVDPEMSKKVGVEFYRYKYPPGVDSPLGQYHYWELMNEIRAKPYVEKFKTCRYLQGRY